MAICWWEIVQFHSVIIDDFFMLSAGDPYLLCAHLDVVPTGERERSSYHFSIQPHLMFPFILKVVWGSVLGEHNPSGWSGLHIWSWRHWRQAQRGGISSWEKTQAVTVASRWEFFRPWRLSCRTEDNQRGRCMWLLDMTKRFVLAPHSLCL